VRSSFAIFDPRVFKIVSSLKKRYSTLVLGWNREEVARKEMDNYIVNLECFSFKTPHGKPSIIHYFCMIIYFAIFWVWVFIKLIKHKPKVVHACDLDTVLPCFIYKLIFRKKMVFDVFDRYAMAFLPTAYKILYLTVNLIEEYFSGKADVLITISEKSLMTFRKRPKHCVIIMNCAEDHALERTSSEHKDVKDNAFTLIYTGGIRRDRSLENITAAIKDLNNVEFVIAGLIVDKKLFDQILSFPYVKYRGFLNPNDALYLEGSADAMIALYDLKIPWNSITIPNKLFEAMMCGVPIITNVSPELIRKLDFGIMVNYDNVNQIRSTIALLRDNGELRSRLGNNGRKAFLEKYNWVKMEEKLYQIYENLVQK
jgi:glycosyltransferase involved in cell wall biosynthesis